MQGLQACQILVRWALRGREGDQANAFKAVEDPARGGPISRFAELIGDRLSRGGELLAQAVLGELVDEEAQYHSQYHDQAQRHDPFGLFDEDRGGQKQRLLEEREAALDSLNAHDKNARAHSRAWSGSQSESPHPRR